VKNPKKQPIRENAVEHRVISASDYTVKENFRDSMIAIYASLTAAHKAQLPVAESLERLHAEFKTHAVGNALLSEFIGPTSVIIDSPLFTETNAWMMEKLQGKHADECRFAITGPSQSGKSTLLFIAATLFYQKIELAEQTLQVFILPFNWANHQNQICEISTLYELIIMTVLRCLRGSRPELLPILNLLQQWFFTLIVVRAFPPFPALIVRFKHFPQAAILQIGREIHTAWKNKADLANFLETIITCPRNIVRAFGFTTIVPIFDHFDACGYLIEPGDSFPLCQKPVSLASIICKVYQTGPLFIASQDDSEFLLLFTCDNCIPLSTERLLSNVEGQELFIANPQFSLNIQMCRGCPGYCAVYQRLCELARQATEDRTLKSQFSRLKSIVDITRRSLVKQELLRVCVLLAAADTDSIFNSRIMNQLSQSEDLIVVVH
jgi:energy-coupling factor transporter ATP-binding protein EcfA2